MNWWKLLSVPFIIYSVIAGLLISLPSVAANSILEETIRNLFFHVPMWFSMVSMLSISAFYSARYMYKGNLNDDSAAVEYVNTGLLLGILGAATGSIWARFTWGQFWPDDAKLNGAGIALMMYFAYIILRKTIDDPKQRARVSAVYSIFSFPIFIVLIFILPRINDSLHPGNGGNPAFGQYDLDNTMRWVFYPAILGWIMLSLWITSIHIRLRKLEELKQNSDEEKKYSTFIIDNAQ